MKMLLILGLCLAISAPVSAQSPESEPTFLAAIARDSKAEIPRYDYAFFLYTKKRFVDCRQQLGFLFALNPQHAGGRRLHKHLSEIEGLADMTYQDQQMRLFVLAKVQAEKQAGAPPLQPVAGQVDPTRMAQVKADLDKRFIFSERIKLEPALETGENAFQDQLALAREKNENDKAEKVARDWMSRYQKSPAAKADFITFLIMRDRVAQAEALLQVAMETSPEYMKLLMLIDTMKDLKQAKSSEQTSAVKRKLSDEMQVYNFFFKGRSEVARVPAAPAVTPPPVAAPVLQVAPMVNTPPPVGRAN